MSHELDKLNAARDITNEELSRFKKAIEATKYRFQGWTPKQVIFSLKPRNLNDKQYGTWYFISDAWDKINKEKK